jgi:tight adherence protein B
MKRLSALGIAALVAMLLGCSAASAAGVHLIQAGGAKFPERAYALSLSSPVKLTPSQVSVTEDGVPVTGLTVAAANASRQSHAGTILLIDTSLSMKGLAIRDAIKAAQSFISVRNPAQPMGIVYFDKTTSVVAPMTTNTKTLQNALARMPTLRFGTYMFSAGRTALQILADAKLTGGAIVLLSNRGDNGSSVSQPALEAAALAQGVRIYTVGLRYPTVFPGHTLQSLAADTNAFYTLAEVSGLNRVYRGLGVEVSNQYLIHYRSVAPLGQPVRVRVAVRGYGTASSGYSAPPLPPPPPIQSRPVEHSSFWSSTGGALITSLVCALLLGAAVLSLARTRATVRARVRDFVHLAPKDEAKQRTLVQRALGDPRVRRIPRSGRWAALELETEIARIPTSPARLAALTIAGTILLGWLLATATSSPIAALIALAIPPGVLIAIGILANRERRAFEEQLPDNLQVVSSALRAGHTFIGSLTVVTEDAPEPSRRELRRALADEQLGVPLEDALNQVSERMRSTDFRHVVLVAVLQRNAGGNTAEVIDLVSETIRDRLDLRRLVRTLTAQGRLAGGILSVLPVLLIIAITLINPSYVSPLYHKTIGIIALVVAVTMVIAGSLIIRRIVDIKI